MGGADRIDDPEHPGPPVLAWDESADTGWIPQPLPPLWERAETDPYAAVTVPAAAPEAPPGDPSAPNPITALSDAAPAGDPFTTLVADEPEHADELPRWRPAASSPAPRVEPTIDLTDAATAAASVIESTGPLPVHTAPPAPAADPAAVIESTGPLPIVTGAWIEPDPEHEPPAAPASEPAPAPPLPVATPSPTVPPPTSPPPPVATPSPTVPPPTSPPPPIIPPPLPTYTPTTIAADSIPPHADPGGHDPGDGGSRHAATPPPWRQALTAGALAVGAVVVGLVTANYWHAGGYPGHPANQSAGPGPGPAVVGTAAGAPPKSHRPVTHASRKPVTAGSALPAPVGPVSAARSAKPSAVASLSAAASPTAHIAAGTATVTVLNETAIKGLAEKEAAAITAAGWNVRRTTNVNARYAVTTVFYDRGQQGQAALLLKTVPSVKEMRLRPNIFLPTGGLIVVVASDAA